MSFNIVWHQRDLRIHDNPALNAAASKPLIPIFIHQPSDNLDGSGGAAANWWLHHSLKSLMQDYQKLGTRLLVFKGSSETIFKMLREKISIDTLHFNVRYEPEFRKRDRLIVESLKSLGIQCEWHEANYLISPGKILNQTAKPYCVFTPFSKAVLSQKNFRSPLKSPPKLQAHTLEGDSLEDLNLLPKINWAEGFSKVWLENKYSSEE